MDEEIVQCIKQTYKMQTTVRVLCDTSYIIYLAARYKNHRDLHNNNPLEQNAHADLMRAFGVERIDLDTTKCVVEDLKAGFGPDELNSKKQPHVIKCALAMRALVCDHHSRPVSSMDCIKSMMDFSYARQHILASNDKQFYTSLQERVSYKLPILTVTKEGFVLLFLKRKLQLKNIKEEKEAEDAQEALNKQLVSRKGKEKTLEEEASKAVGIVMDKTSKKGKQKQLKDTTTSKALEVKEKTSSKGKQIIEEPLTQAFEAREIVKQKKSKKGKEKVV